MRFGRGVTIFTIVDDLTRSRVLYVAEDCTPSTLDGVCERFMTGRGIQARMEPAERWTKLRNSELNTARAWALEETAMAVYAYQYERPRAQALPVVAWLGGEKPIETNDRRSQGC
jgi:hypothetical protein